VPDDRTPPRRHQTSTERDLAGLKARRDTPARGVPTFLDVDGDLTPAPAKLPPEQEREQLSPDERIRELEVAATANARAVAHEQQARREGKEIGALEAKVEALAGVAHDVVRATAVLDQTVLPAVRGLAEDMRLVFQSRDHDVAQREEVVRRLANIERSIGAVDERTRHIEVLAQRIDTIGADLKDVTHRVGKLEARTNALDTHRKISTALTRREQAKVGGLGGAAGLIASALAWLVSHFTR
jgi:hypothetical protein